MADMQYNYGAMGSGKTTMLLQMIHEYEKNGFKIVLLKSIIDDKGEKKVISRMGIEREVDFLIKKEDVIRDLFSFDDLRCIFVDEAQFLTKTQVNELYNITKYDNVPVQCFGLRSDFKTNGFEGSDRLLQIADKLNGLNAICRCGENANLNLRLKNGIPVFTGKKIVIDNKKTKYGYEGICGCCYLKEKEASFQRKREK